MEKLYALSIAGRTFLLSGMLSTKECHLIDSIANSFMPLVSENEKQLCQRFLAEVYEHLGIQLNQIPIYHVFRIDVWRA